MYISNATVHVDDTKSDLTGWSLTPSSRKILPECCLLTVGALHRWSVHGHNGPDPLTVPPKLKEACIKRPLGKICARSPTPANMRRGFTKSQLSHLSDLPYLSYFSIFSLLSVCIYLSYATILILSHQNSGWMCIYIYCIGLIYLIYHVLLHLIFSLLFLSCLVLSFHILAYLNLIVFIFSFGASCSGVM